MEEEKCEKTPIRGWAFCYPFTVVLTGTDAPTSRIRKQPPDRHHQDRVRRGETL